MRLFIGVLTLLPLLAAAETAYVTDNLRLNLYQNADLTGTRIDTLVSGQEFEVLSRNAQTALVELTDGRQGYVSAAYMVFDKPARLIVAETQAENERLSGELETLRQSFAEPAALIESLRQESVDLQATIDANAARMAELEEENQSQRFELTTKTFIEGLAKKFRQRCCAGCTNSNLRGVCECGCSRLPAGNGDR